MSLPSWPTSTPRDGLSRVGAIAPIDGQNRVQAKKVLKGMSWLGTSLVVTVHGRSVTVSPGRPSGPHQSRMRVDSAGRLTLPSHVLAALTVRAGEQVVLAGVPEAQVLNLKAAADVLQGITGPMSLGVQEDEAPSPAQQPTGTRLARAAYADYSRSGD